jgi:hypothetical protein
LDYARRTDNPLRTQAEFAKAAEGNAQEAAKHYNDNILGPNESIHRPVPSNYGGTSYTPGGENPQTTASLGDINKRVIQINKELSKPKLNVSDQRTALAQEADLQAEHAGLTDLLHRSLSNLTGIPPEEIANLRQRVGRSYEFANEEASRRSRTDHRARGRPIGEDLRTACTSRRGQSRAAVLQASWGCD